MSYGYKVELNLSAPTGEPIAILSKLIDLPNVFDSSVVTNVDLAFTNNKRGNVPLLISHIDTKHQLVVLKSQSRLGLFDNLILKGLLDDVLNELAENGWMVAKDETQILKLEESLVDSQLSPRDFLRKHKQRMPKTNERKAFYIGVASWFLSLLALYSIAYESIWYYSIPVLCGLFVYKFAQSKITNNWVAKEQGRLLRISNGGL
ncbi:hypothetical protein [Vibrio sp. WXL210]|uniref:hypothetical protein n=1 Tax=Vibrio sp. WXL210 TaxID=3450709 RepID=UPI003EC90D27